MAIDPYSALLAANNIGAAFGAKDPRSFGATLGAAGDKVLRGLLIQKELERQKKAKEEAEGGGLSGLLAPIGAVAGSLLGGPVVGSAIGSALGGAAGSAIDGQEINPLSVIADAGAGALGGWAGGVVPAKAAAAVPALETASPLLEPLVAGRVADTTSQLLEPLGQQAAAIAPGVGGIAAQQSLYAPTAAPSAAAQRFPRIAGAVNAFQTQKLARTDPMALLSQQAQTPGSEQLPSAGRPLDLLAPVMADALGALRNTSVGRRESLAPLYGLSPEDVMSVQESLRQDEQLRLQEEQLAAQTAQGGRQLDIQQLRADNEAAQLEGAGWQSAGDGRFFNPRTGETKMLGPNPLEPVTVQSSFQAPMPDGSMGTIVQYTDGRQEMFTQDRAQALAAEIEAEKANPGSRYNLTQAEITARQQAQAQAQSFQAGQQDKAFKQDITKEVLGNAFQTQRDNSQYAKEQALQTQAESARAALADMQAKVDASVAQGKLPETASKLAGDAQSQALASLRVKYPQNVREEYNPQTRQTELKIFGTGGPDIQKELEVEVLRNMAPAITSGALPPSLAAAVTGRVSEAVRSINTPELAETLGKTLGVGSLKQNPAVRTLRLNNSWQLLIYPDGTTDYYNTLTNETIAGDQ